jgi:hypothetical protein
MNKLVFSILLTAFLTACGGGSGGTPSNGGANKSAAGVWDNDEQDADFLLVALIDERNHALFYQFNAPLLLQCQLIITGNNFSCSPASEGYSVAGTISERNRLVGSIRFEGNVEYDFELNYVDFSDNQTPLEDFVANWQQNAGDYTETITIDADGDITGTDTDNCVVSGSVDYISPNINVQSFRIEYSNCQRANEYIGKGVIIPEQDPMVWRIFASTATEDLILDSSFTKQ